jgi:hypothetical protein
MRDFRHHESHRGQSYGLSTSRHLQGGRSGDSFFLAARVDGKHSDGEAERFARRESDHHCFLSSARRLAAREVTRFHQRASFARDIDRVGRSCSGSGLSELSSVAEARRVTSSESDCAVRRGDFTTAFTEEGLVRQMTMPNNSLQPMPVGRLSSAFAVDIRHPAWLSSGR